MNKRELQEELKDIKTLYIVGITKGTNPRWDRGIWRTFRVYYLKDGELRNIFINSEKDDYPSCWNPKKGLFESRVLGMDRVLDIVSSLGEWLFNDPYRFKGVFLSFDF